VPSSLAGYRIGEDQVRGSLQCWISARLKTEVGQFLPRDAATVNRVTLGAPAQCRLCPQKRPTGRLPERSLRADIAASLKWSYAVT